MICRPAERTTDRRLAVPCTESPPDQDKPPSGPPNQTIRLPPQDSDFGRHNAPARAFGRGDYPTTRSGASLRKTRQPDDAQWREHSEEENTRRDALPGAFGRKRQEYPTTRTGAGIRRRVPDDAQWREHSDD